MRTLSSEQKEQLTNHIAKKPIKYIGLYNELYDHYASTYEIGENDFENTLEALDQEFDYYKVKSINDNLVDKTRKSVNQIYVEEFKNFWRWPQIMTTLGILFLCYSFIEFLPMKIIVWYVFMPFLIFTSAILIYGGILTKRKKYGNKRFESAHLASAHHFLSLPVTLFNLTVFLPALFLEPYKPRIEFYENYPLIAFILMMIFFIAAYIGFKVFKSKIRVQYL
ncbi:hypothetical protein [Marivirga sp.]|uniref:hypothetical protein n=1 Tax=Marivirga sp. TaxID=2018662 RepID=UPI0025EA3719|nr:hypothetical protein [Marivirga sp.]